MLFNVRIIVLIMVLFRRNGPADHKFKVQLPLFKDLNCNNNFGCFRLCLLEESYQTHLFNFYKILQNDYKKLYLFYACFVQTHV